MFARARRAITFANVASALALFIALGTGTAYAANTVFSTDIVDGQVKTADIADDAATTAKIAVGAVGSGRIHDGSIANIDIATGAIRSNSVLANSLTTADIAGSEVNGSISLSGIANGRCTQVTFTISGAQVGDVAIVSTRAAIQNGIVLSAARVASAGHVEVNACNFSGGAMTPISGFPVHVLTFR